MAAVCDGDSEERFGTFGQPRTPFVFGSLVPDASDHDFAVFRKAMRSLITDLCTHGNMTGTSRGD